MSNAENRGATSSQTPLQSEAGRPPTSSTSPGGPGRGTPNPTPEEVAELVYRLFCLVLRTERERLKGR
jgi:hypothetical protein